MIVPRKPIFMRKSTYLNHIVRTFMEQTPPRFHSGPLSIVALALRLRLEKDYPDRAKIQCEIDALSIAIMMAEAKEKEERA